MTRRTYVVLATTLALSFAGGCETPSSIPAGAFSHPIDLAYACEGGTHTVAPDNDERPEVFSTFERTRMCPDVSTNAGAVQGFLLGMVLNQQPPGVVVVQMNPAGQGGTRVLDTDLFIPGLTPIPVGDGPTRILTAPDWDAFYVVSAGSRDLTRIVVGQIQGLSSVGVQRNRIPLPGIPGMATIYGEHLLVASASTPELWALTADGSETVVSIQLPGVVQDMGVLGPDLVLTWTERPVLSRWQVPEVILSDGGSLGAGSGELDEVGLVSPCMDTLDNDDDGAVDADDPDCRGPGDVEDARAVDAPEPGDSTPFYESDQVTPCTDGLDNDRDGFTDGADTACGDEQGKGELLPACADGLDDDGDGLVDLADPDCYGADDLSERSPGGWGPARIAVVDGEEHGRFVYVLNQGAQELLAFDATTNGELERIVVSNHEATIPALSYIPYDEMPQGESTEISGRNVANLPGPFLNGERSLSMPDPVGGQLTAGQIRGELWTRLIDPAEGEERPSVPLSLSSGVSRRPVGCAPDATDRCVQPDGDDDTWFLFLPRLDGRIQLMESISRGTPVHRHVQSVVDPEERIATLPARPTLSVSGSPVFVGTSPIAGHPFLGPMVKLEEVTPSEPGVAPPLYRSYGVWPGADPEQVPTETWSVTYEGVLPGTGGHLARMVDGFRVHDPLGRFCERGVEPGDWLLIRTTPEQVHPDLRTDPLGVETDTGQACDIRPTAEALIEAPIIAVGLTTLTLDPDKARLRRPAPVLDASAIEDKGISSAACADALEALLSSPQWMDPVDVEDLEAAELPERFSYEIRPEDTWVVEGSRSGFLHRQTWAVDTDTGEGACVTDEELSELATGRAQTASLGVDAYTQCPPTNIELSLDEVDELLADDHLRFANFSFSMDIFPGCDEQSDTGELMTRIRRDTRWSFGLQGPDNPRSVSGSDMQLAPKVPLLEFRRQQIQLDSALSRVLLLEIRPGSSVSLQSHF